MIKVLIVDDEPLARENLRVFLQEQSILKSLESVQTP